MASRYSDIVNLRSMRPAYSIKEEGAKDWITFIANDQFNDLLKKTVSAVRNNDADAHKPIWIAGTYGSGKSHAGAVLKHLLCDPVDEIEEYVQDEYKDASHASLRNSIMQLRSEKRLFPVQMYGIQQMAYEADLSYQIQCEVTNALREAGIHLTVQTDFDKYVEHIENDPDFWQMRIDRNEMLRSVAPDLNKLKQQLHNGNTEVLNRLTNALREGGFGDIRLNRANLKTWLFEVQNELRKQGEYNGLLILWDEFTEVLTSAIGTRLLVQIQEISEAMMNPENDSYFLFISHPSALNSLKEEEREKTKGRYHYVVYNMETVSAFRIMSKKFKVVDSKTYSQRLNLFAKQNSDLLDKFAKYTTSNNPDQTRHDLENLFPIHPATANLATYFAREAGSSSRSVFDFLASDYVKSFFDDENAYAEKLTVTSDYLWDYVHSYFEGDTARFGAVTERYNSHHLAVEAMGSDYSAVFKGILLLNALNNIANNDSVTPSRENIYMLFEGTPIYNDIETILDWFNDKSIIQRQPNGNFSILFTALPTDEIQKIKDELTKVTYLYTDTVIKFGETARNTFDKWIAQVNRPVDYQFFSLQANEFTLLNRVEVARKNAQPYVVQLAIMVGRTSQEVFELRDIINRATNDERFQNVCFVLMERPMEQKNYDRFIEYQANATCAQAHGLHTQQQTYQKDASEMISNWMTDIRSGNVTFTVKGKELTVAGSKIASTINSAIAPEIFTAGPESLMIIKTRSSNTFWKKSLVKATVSAVLTYTTKSEIIEHCGGPAKHVEYLLQDSVDDNLEWKTDVDSDHPLKQVCDFVQNAFNHTNKNQTFNLGDKLVGLTEAPFGLFQTYAPMAMVAFAMRRYAGKIFDTNGKQRTSQHLVDDVVEMFKAWESGKSSNKLNFMFESREAGALTKSLIKIFKLKQIKGYNDISSLKDARWAMTHEFTDLHGYPLWSLKYVECPDEHKQVIDNVVRVITDSESVKNPDLLGNTANGLKTYEFEVGNLIYADGKDNFAEGFHNYLLSLSDIQLKENEQDEAFSYLKGHMEATIGLWGEEAVHKTLLMWRADQYNKLQQQQQEAERKRQEEEERNRSPKDNNWNTGNNRWGSQSMAAEESTDILNKRQKAGKSISRIESSHKLQQILKEICDQCDETTLDLILRYV